MGTVWSSVAHTCVYDTNANPHKRFSLSPCRDTVLLVGDPLGALPGVLHLTDAGERRRCLVAEGTLGGKQPEAVPGPAMKWGLRLFQGEAGRRKPIQNIMSGSPCLQEL